jgi:hypothetical protein
MLSRLQRVVFQLDVDTCGGTQRQYSQAHGYQSSFHPEVFQVLNAQVKGLDG